MGGGSSHRRRKARRAQERMGKNSDKKNGGNLIVVSITTPPPPPPMSAIKQQRIGTDRFIAVSSGAVAIVLAFVGLTEMFPLWINLIVYAGGVMSILFAVWRWERSENWSSLHKTAVLSSSLIVYCALLAFPVAKQYAKEMNVNVIFKDSPSLPWWRKLVIIHDISNMQEYLSSLGIPKPSYLPPVSVEDNVECGQTTPPDVPKYRSTITLGRDRYSVTWCYADFVVGQLILTKDPPRIPRLMASQLFFPRYFAATFWNKKPTGAPLLFWNIREKLGNATGDKLIATTLVVISDDSTFCPSFSPSDWYPYLAEQIRIADSITDSGCSNWPVISEVLKKDGAITATELKNRDFTHYGASNACLEQWRK
jgi:hypothetical protein